MTRRFVPDLPLGDVLASIHSAREVLPTFGRKFVTTEEAAQLLARWDVESVITDLPRKYAAHLSPLLLGRVRQLSLADHVPVEARKLVRLHEAGHLYQGTASQGIAYNTREWHTQAEQAADAFAAVALLPSHLLDSLCGVCTTREEQEELVLENLMYFAEGLWRRGRACQAVRNRLLIREKLGV
jgi:hypothetical protein